MQPKQVKEMLAALPASSIPQTDREDCKSAISFFLLLKKRTGTDGGFLSKLESVLSECNCADFLSTIQEYKVQNPDLFQEPPSQLSPPDGTRTGFKPKPGQSEKFRSSLLRISRTIGKKQLEIMVGLSPTPEAAKQNISEGHDLFEQMENHGCISENDTEMLQEMLELLRLQGALKFLYEYHQAFPPLHDPPPCPSAPRYGFPPSSSLQGQYGSLPVHGRQYPSHQPQSFHVSQPHSLPSSSPSSSIGHGSKSGEGGGGGLSMPYMESREQASSPTAQRPFNPSVSTPLQQPSFRTTVKLFPRQGGGGGSAASSPPGSHAPSLAGSSNDMYHQHLAKKQSRRSGATPNGSLHYEESHGAQISSPSSGTYPRPLQEMEKSYHFPTKKVLHGQDLLKKNDDPTVLSPPSAKRQPPPLSSSSSQALETGGLSTLSSFVGTSDKFGSAIPQGHNPDLNPSLSSLESYRANFSFPAGGERPPSVNVSGFQQPIHDVSAAASRQRPPPFNPRYVPNSSAASLGSTPSYSASINIPEAPGQASLGEGGGGGDQLRNAQPVGSVECARHPDDLAGLQQPFHNQYASHSASVVPASQMPSLSQSGYSGHPSSEFPSGIEEGGGGQGGGTQPPGSGRKRKSFSRAYNSPPVPADKRKSVLSKSEARNAQGAAAQFESINEAAVAGSNSQLSKYQQQLLEYQNRHPNPYAQVSEYGRNIAQASSESNVELRRTRSMQGALATAKEGEQPLQQPSSSSAENLLYQTAAESNQLYPRLPLDTSFETASSSSSGGASAAQIGTKRTRSQSKKLENPEEVVKEEEEQGTAAKRQKTAKKPSTSKKRGIFSRLVGYFVGNSASNDDDQSQEEGCENTESESEYHSAKED